LVSQPKDPFEVIALLVISAEDQPVVPEVDQPRLGTDLLGPF
jgi:hypothetical protein